MMASLFRLLCLSISLIALSGCYERHEWRQKLTVVVDTPAGEVSGSAVVQVNVTYYGQLPATGSEVDYEISGEATSVEITPTQYLFVLLDGSEERFHRAARERFQGMKRQEWLREIGRQEAPIIIPPEQMPPMVAFLDISDPSFVRSVDADSFEQVFGDGYHLKEVLLEITDEPVVSGVVEDILSWWLTMRSGPRGQMVSLRLPDNSPRGWTGVTSASFWSLDLRQQFNEQNK